MEDKIGAPPDLTDAHNQEFGPEQDMSPLVTTPHTAGERIYGSINDTQKSSSSTDDTPVQFSQTSSETVPPLRTLLALSVSNLLVGTPYNGNQNIQSSINSAGSLGVITLACVYTTVIVGAPLATSVIRKVGCKSLLLAHWAMNFFFIAANFYPKFYTLLPASIMAGITSSCLGTINGLYLTAASESHLTRAGLSKDRIHVVLSLYFGIFFTFAELSQLTGNFISSLVLFVMAPSSSNMTLVISPQCGAGTCPQANGNTTVFTPPSQTTLYTLYGIFLSSVVLGFLVTLTLMPKLTMDHAKVSVCREISGCYRVLLDPKYALLIPIIMGQAMTVMILFTGFTQAFVSCSLGVEWVGFIMMVYGASSGTFASAANYLARYVGRVALVITFILIDSGLLLTLLLWTADSKHILFLIAGVAGISEGISQPQFNSIVSTVFRDNLTPAFVAYNMVKCLGFSISLAISSFACLYHRLYLAISLYGLGLVGYIVTEILVHRQTRVVGRKPAVHNKDTMAKRINYYKVSTTGEHTL